MRAFVVSAILATAFCLAAAQDNPSSVSNSSFGTWTVQSPQLSTGRAELTSTGPTRRLIGIFTPDRDLIITRIEALSEYGPAAISDLRTQPRTCPLPFSIEVLAGDGAHQVQLSGKFMDSESGRTYTNSGSLALSAKAGTAVKVFAVVPSATGYPPVGCICAGLQITVQYKLSQ